MPLVIAMRNDPIYDVGDLAGAEVRTLNKGAQEEEPVEGSSSGSRKRTISRAASFVLTGNGRPHQELRPGADVRLRPLVCTDGDGRINKIAISGRTPSPFGRVMGDHTVAWQVVVDEVHALLYRKKINEAAALLKQAHAHASGWMQTTGTPGKQLLRYLEDNTARWERLEDATFHVNHYLDRITVETEAGQLTALGKAIAYHLAYLNYLPFETVPAMSARGSHGSGEGQRRGFLIAYERRCRHGQLGEIAALDEEPAAGGDESSDLGEPMETDEVELTAAEQTRTVRRLRDSAWGLFDFAAAVRESHLEYMLEPGLASTARNTRDVIADLAARMNAIATKLKAGRTQDALTDLQAIAAKAEKLSQADTSAAFIRAANLIRERSQELAHSLAWAPRAMRSAATRCLNDKSLAGAIDIATQSVANLEQDCAAAPRRAPLILATLLRRHLTALAAAYPNSVQDSELLRPTPALAAYARLESWLETSELTVSRRYGRQALADLAEAFSTAFGDEAIEPAADEAWVDDAGHSGLVVAWDAQSGTLIINGRAAAPEGVAGMGSHTTAWVLECDALRAIIASATPMVRALAEAVTEDLAGDVILLDQLLPADQLEGSQLTELFHAAAKVLTASQAEAGAAARAYLEFRNLLPFATVDEGSRGGRGEHTGASAGTFLDNKSLTEAADSIYLALTDPPRMQHISLALHAASDRLADEAEIYASTWPPAVREAARASAGRLSERACELGDLLAEQALDTTIAVRSREWIVNTRQREHQRVYDTANPDTA